MRRGMGPQYVVYIYYLASAPVAGGTGAAVSPGGLAMCAMCASVAAEGRPVGARAERRRGAGRRARPMIRATPLTVVAARARMQ